MMKMEIKSFEEACAARGYDPAAILPDMSAMPVRHQAALQATAKLYIIAEALNEGWEPDWDDDGQYKYYPWFDLEVHKKNNPTGFRFYGSRYDYSGTYSTGGSRLCFRTRELSDYAGKTFVELYRNMMVLPKG
jgi:hypothetical protein